jgi:major intracellular serine protease
MEYDPNKMSWGHKFLNIPFIWNELGTMGDGVTIAIIDTGIDINHEDLVPGIHQLSKSFVDTDNKVLSDADGHGTNMAGIIGAFGNKTVFGVAPHAKLLIVKATNHKNDFDLNVFSHAVNYVAFIPEVDIVSISYSFLINNPKLESAIQNCLDANKIVITAIGNGRNPSKQTDLDTYPACYNDGIKNTRLLAVGSFDIDGNLCSFSNWNNHLNLLAPGDFSILTTGRGNIAEMGAGTSIAAAFTSGCLALLISYLRVKHQSISDIVQTLLESCDSIGPSGFNNSCGNGRLNLRNTILKIK